MGWAGTAASCPGAVSFLVAVRGSRVGVWLAAPPGAHPRHDARRCHTWSARPAPGHRPRAHSPPARNRDLLARGVSSTIGEPAKPVHPGSRRMTCAVASSSIGSVTSSISNVAPSVDAVATSKNRSDLDDASRRRHRNVTVGCPARRAATAPGSSRRAAARRGRRQGRRALRGHVAGESSARSRKRVSERRQGHSIARHHFRPPDSAPRHNLWARGRRGRRGGAGRVPGRAALVVVSAVPLSQPVPLRRRRWPLLGGQRSERRPPTGSFVRGGRRLR